MNTLEENNIDCLTALGVTVTQLTAGGPNVDAFEEEPGYGTIVYGQFYALVMT